jgi:hypothetical protein
MFLLTLLCLVTEKKTKIKSGIVESPEESCTGWQ